MRVFSLFTKGAFLILLLSLIILAVVSLFFKSQNNNNQVNQVFLPTPVPHSSSRKLQKIPMPTIHTTPELNAKKAKIIFDFGNITLPTKARVYRVISRGVSEQSARQLASRLGFKTEPQSSQDVQGTTSLLFISSDKNEYLSVSLNTGYIEYGNSRELIKSDPAVPMSSTAIQFSSKTNLIDFAQNFLKEKGLYSSGARLDSVGYYTGGLEPVQTQDFNKANFYDVVFQRTLDNMTIYYQYANKSQIEVLIDNYKMIKKVSLETPIVLGDFWQYSIPGIDEIEKEIENGQGAVVSYGKLGDIIPGHTVIKSIILNKISLNYLDYDKSSFIYPILVLGGTAINSSGDQKNILMYLPSIGK